ncbi:MAG: DUF4139 domain-containing protein [Burkholderiales bacterium]|nr:DUF4139 domain-containing protein [Phycisphaerae bacterium]
MRHPLIASLITSLGILLLTSRLPAEEQTVTSKIESVGLFKNGLAVVDRSVELAGPGTYRIEDVPTPVHGTFFIESASDLVAKTTTMLVDAPLDLAGGSLQDQLSGKEVSITLREQTAPIDGVVAKIDPKQEKPWNRQYDQPQYGYYNGQPIPIPSAGRFVILDTATGRTLVDQSTITSIKITGEAKLAKQRKPVLLLTLAAGAPKQTIRLTYLTRGIAWAPSYRVELLDDKKLSITQNAVVKNELMDLKDVELFLISGYPSVDFGHVTSPLSLQQNWSAFFQQLSQRPGNNRFDNGIQRQSVISNFADSARTGGDVSPESESIDIHYETIGKQSLADGDAMSLNVASGETAYERIVEWTVPDTRDVNGRYVQDHQRQQEPEKYEDAAWDAAKFTNPLKFSMTTAPATFMRDGKFLGQQTSKWTNQGEKNTLRITKALSIRTRATEQEEPNTDRQIVFVGGNDFRKTSVTGELTIHNYRKTDTTILIKRQFSGDLTSADEKPEVTLREEGAWSVNRRNELAWTITLKAGEEKTLKYAYTVLVDN